MSLFRLIARGLLYHRRMHAGLLIGVSLACAILTGALLVGNSVNGSLRDIATVRLGRIDYALDWGNRFFAQDLDNGDASHFPRAAAVLALRGMASLPSDRVGPRNQINRVQVLGIDAAFWQFAEDASCHIELGPQAAAINEKTAAALGLKPGDDFSLRIVKSGPMPYDAPLSSRKEGPSITSLVTVKAVLSDAQLGRFSLAANQTTPYNVFVDRTWLQEQTELTGLANLIVAKGRSGLKPDLGQSWQPEQVGLRLRTHPSGLIQLESTRIFLEEEVVRAALEIPGASATLTYLVNSISKGDRTTPYSFVVAGPAPPDMRDDQVAINQWLADQLGAGPGDALDMKYFQLLPSNAFVERDRRFTVHSVISMDAMALERDLAPDFPGLSHVEDCRDWDIGMPLDKARLDDPPNEAYWRQYRQTPKLLVTLKAGQDMWANRFGAVTAIRFPASAGNESAIRKALREKISPEKIGLRFVPVRQAALDAVAQAMDFGGLFTGMSLFLIVAALILLGLLYLFGLQQRTSEIGILRALGFPHGTVRLLFLLEACPSMILGAILGAGAGAAYARLLIAALTRYWPAAVAGATIHFHGTPATYLYGAVSATLCAFLIVVGTVFRSTRRSPRELLMTGFSERTGKPPHFLWLALPPSLALISAAVTAGYAWMTSPEDLVLPFFAVGTLLLVTALGYYWCFLTCLARRPTPIQLRLWKIAVADLARRRGRSVSVAGLTACGCFLVFSVSSMQENVALHADARASGTGGFGIYAETTAPIVETQQLDKRLEKQVVPLRVHDGDDAGCLNLNHAQTPRVIGVNTRTLSALGAFLPERGGKNAPLWELLEETRWDGAIPALVGDTNTALWGLKKKTGLKDGDTLVYRDENGGEVKLKLVGRLPMRLSVFQGSILIADDVFARLFPSEAGFRAFLIDTPAGNVGETAASLNRAFARFGMEAVPAVERLREFYAVEATYLAMFLVLGGFGLILGAGGAAVVVLRNVFERRAEIGILHALGYERATVMRLLFAEHALLVLTGTIFGALAAAAAILPRVLASQTAVSLRCQAARLPFILVANLTSVGVVLRAGLPRNPVAHLREE